MRDLLADAVPFPAIDDPSNHFASAAFWAKARADDRQEPLLPNPMRRSRHR